MSSIDSYSRKELRAASGAPDKGDICHHCGALIPRFAEMDSKLREHLIRLIESGDSLIAIQVLVSNLDCPLGFAKSWVIHRGEAKPTYPGPPCPYCGKALHTARAIRCKSCLRAWHNREPPKPKYEILFDMQEAASCIGNYDGDPADFQLAIAEELLDVSGANMAVITDLILARGWKPYGYHQMDGYRIFRYQ